MNEDYDKYDILTIYVKKENTEMKVVKKKIAIFNDMIMR